MVWRRVSSPQIGQTMTIAVKLCATRNRRGPVQLTITNSLIIVRGFDLQSSFDTRFPELAI